MKKSCLAAACGAALLVTGGFANAQGTGTGSSASGTSTNKCWDVSNNVVRDRSGTDATGPSGNTTVGSSASSTGTSAPTGTSANANASARPPGIPDC